MESQGSKKESKIPVRVDNKSDEGVKWNKGLEMKKHREILGIFPSGEIRFETNLEI